MTSGSCSCRSAGHLGPVIVLAVAIGILPATDVPARKDAGRRQGEAQRELLAASASSVKARLSGAGRDSSIPAWRTDLAALVREVERIATTAKRPDKVELIDSDGNFRGAVALLDSLNQPIWFGKHAGPTNELHGALAAAFAGEFLWNGQLKSAQIDPRTGGGRIEISLPPADLLPSGVALVDAATVTVPAAAVPAGGFPLAGARVSVTGVLKDGPTDSVWVAYGIRSNLGKTQILVQAEAYSVEEVSESPVAAAVPAPSSPRVGLEGILRRTLTPPGDWWVRSVEFSPDGQSLIVSRDMPGKYSVFSMATRDRDERLEAREPNGYERVRVSADGKLWAVRSKPRVGDANLKIYALPDLSLVRTIRDTDVSYGDFWWLPDNKTLAVQHVYRLSLWSAETGENVSAMDQREPVKAISRDGRYLVAATSEPQGASHASGYPVEIIPTGNPSAKVSFIAHKEWIGDVAFSPDGRTVASVSADRMIKVWSVPDGKLLRSFEGPESIITTLCYASDGKTLVSGGSDGAIRLWDVASGSEIGRLTIPRCSIRCLDMSPDGLTLAVGEESGMVSLLDFPQLKIRAQNKLASAGAKR